MQIQRTLKIRWSEFTDCSIHKKIPSIETSLNLFQEAESVEFKDLGLVDALCEAAKTLGWKHPTKIQREAIPVALEGRVRILLINFYHMLYDCATVM